jgi:hypothetical protein
MSFPVAETRLVYFKLIRSFFLVSDRSKAVFRSHQE